VVPPAKLPLLVKDMDDLPAPRLPDPAGGVVSLFFLQEVIDNKANAIIIGNENTFFIIF
jgi:hypothetical protein